MNRNIKDRIEPLILKLGRQVKKEANATSIWDVVIYISKCWVIGAIIGVCFVGGCSLIGSNPSPPTKFELGLFDVITNHGAVNIVYATNTTVLTNTITITQTNLVNVTNVLGQIVQQPVITVVPVSTSIVTNWNISSITITNPDTYFYTQNKNAELLKGTASTVGNIVSPGSGALIGAGLSGLLTLWAYFRGNKFKNGANSLAQIIETGREVFKAVPGGAALEQKWLGQMQDQQQADGTKATVEGIVKSPAVSNSKAQSDAQGIVAKVTVANTPTPPAAAPKLG